MDKEARRYFEKVKRLAAKLLKEVKIQAEDYGKERSLLTFEGRFVSYRIVVSELVLLKGKRRYAYYILDGRDNRLIRGFDNSPDITVLKLKYPARYNLHKGELVPHIHGKDKKNIELAHAEMDCFQFLDLLRKGHIVEE